MPKQVVSSKSAPTTGFSDNNKPAPIVQAIRCGNMLFVSGQGPLDPETKTVVAGDIEIQTRRTLDNLLAVLEAGGASLKHVVNMRVILRDVADFKRFNEVYREYFSSVEPCRTTVEVSRLPTPIHVELKVIATID